MDRDLLNHLPVILAVARRKNFAAAASPRIWAHQLHYLGRHTHFDRASLAVSA